MPLAAPINVDMRSGTPGQTVGTPSGAALNGTAPVFIDLGSEKAGNFVSNAAASYFRHTFTADSDFGQLVVDFIAPSTALTSNKEFFPLGGSGAILCSPVLTTANTLLMRDASSSTVLTGWTAPTLVGGVKYRFQIALIKGSSNSTGSLKARLTRMDTGVVVAQGLMDGTANAGTVQCNGALAGLRTASGNGSVQVTFYRISNQAFDYLEDIPVSSGSETPVSAADGVAFIGDSTTDRSGNGSAQVKAAILNNGQSFESAKVQVNGLTSRTINYDNGVHPTAIEQIDVYRNASYDPGIWAFAVGGNGGGSDLATQKGWIQDILNKVAAGSRSAYKVIIFGFARQASDNADAARFWQALNETTTVPSKVTLVKVNYNAELHNGRSESGLWQSTSPTEAHMTATGYSLRDQIMAPYITKPVATNQAPTGTAGATSQVVGRIALNGTAQDPEGQAVTVKWACTIVPSGVPARIVENDTSLSIAQFYYSVAGTYSGTLTLTDSAGAQTVKTWSIDAPELPTAASTSGKSLRKVWNGTSFV